MRRRSHDSEPGSDQELEVFRTSIVFQVFVLCARAFYHVFWLVYAASMGLYPKFPGQLSQDIVVKALGVVKPGYSISIADLRQ
jgi:hypothetical protein